MWGYFKNIYCNSNVRLDTKVTLVTGCNAGIGKETVKDFYKRGAKVWMACRNMDKAQAAMNDIMESCKDHVQLGHLELIHLDLSSLASVRRCVNQILQTETKLDILVNNAGVASDKATTEEGFDLTFCTNYLAHFLLTLMLLPLLRRSEAARIVNLSSVLHWLGSVDPDDLQFETRNKYWIYRQTPQLIMLFTYSQSKLAMLMFTHELDRRLKIHGISNIKTYCVHPGNVKTQIWRNINFPMKGSGWTWRNVIQNLLLFKTCEEGAQTIIYCSVDEECSKESGLYYSNCQKGWSSTYDNSTAQKLWENSCQLIGLNRGEILDIELTKQRIV